MVIYSKQKYQRRVTRESDAEVDVQEVLIDCDISSESSAESLDEETVSIPTRTSRAGQQQGS